MTLCLNMNDLQKCAVDGDLQCVSGVALAGFRSDFTDVLSTIKSWPDVPKNQALSALRAVLGIPVEETDEATLLNSIARLLAGGHRDYNRFNHLLGFGVVDMDCEDILKALTPFGLADPPPADLLLRHRELINSEYQFDTVGKKVFISPAIPNADTPITDRRSSRLLLKVDLSEWLEIPNRDIRYVVVEDAVTLSGYNPLGRVTVWMTASTQIQHARSKTAKTFIRGQIAQRLRIEDIEANLAGFVNTIFDSDSEQAYSTTSSPC